VYVTKSDLEVATSFHAFRPPLWTRRPDKLRYNLNLGSALLRATSDDIECGMWNVECRVMYRREK
jgi:hypothetical protein